MSSPTSIPGVPHPSPVGDVQGFRFSALGCSARIRIAGVSPERATQFVSEAANWLRDLESRLTRFSDTSLVGQLNRNAGISGIRPDADLLSVLEAADRAHRITSGRFDATALPLYRLWHDPNRMAWPSSEELNSARDLVAWNSVQRTPDLIFLPRMHMALDLGGVGKEWCVDRLIQRAETSGIENILVELGGDCAARGHQPGRDGWLVLLPGAAAAMQLCNEALATSGIGTRKRTLEGRDIPHLINAQTGMPANGSMKTVTVQGSDCLTAGIYASDLCLLDRGTPDLIPSRCGGLATWCLTATGQILADPRILSRVHPVSNTQRAA